VKFLLQTDLHQPIWKLSVVLTLAATWYASGRNAVTIQQIDMAAGGKNVKVYTKIFDDD
jgi:ribosomal protein S24E